ncbi:MAG: histidine phosphatase family protein [Planctomycetes bacterium]|nr:histidine phosphatase family protein [Planctomycetota bacterium]
MALKQKTIVLSLIKCGETTWEVDGRLQGRSDLPLSPQGRSSVEQDVATLAGLRMGTIYHPANEAASETAELVARLVGAKTKPLAELAEADLGLLDGLTEQAFAERFPKRYKQWQEDPLSVSLPEGEVVGEARARLFLALGRLLKRSRNNEVGVVLQSLGLGFLRCWLAARPPTELWTLLKCRPRIERYLMAMETISQLAEAAKVQYSHS